MTLLTWLLVLTPVVLALHSLVWYWRKRGGLPGPTFVIPWIGCIIDLVMHPVEFWQKQRDYAPNGISVNYILGNLMVFITNTEVAKSIFQQVDDFVLYAHPNATFLFGPENLIFKDPDVHRRYRSLLHKGMFGEESLHSYLEGMETSIREFMQEKVVGKEFIDARLELRFANALASQRSFCGPYLPESVRGEMAEDILTFTQGFLCFPLPFPGTGLGRAIAARKRLRTHIIKAVEQSKEYIAKGGKPRCVLDYWCVEAEKRGPEYTAAGITDTGTETGHIASTVLDFLFASQDATTSAIMWTLHHCDKDKEVLKRVRREVRSKVRRGEPLAKHWGELTYTHAATRELLRCYPPVPMVPHMAKRDVQIADNFVVPAGAMVVPCMIDAARNEPGFKQFHPEENPDPQFYRTMVFGAGQHMCPGRYYAQQLIAIFLAVFSEYKIERMPSPKNDEYMYLPTLFPSENMYEFTPLAAGADLD